MTRLALVFVVSALLIVSQQEVLTYEDLTTTSWKFYSDAGYLGTLTFSTNGKIAGYSNPN